MKTIEGFKLRKLGNEYILVGESMALINFNKMVTLNESAAFLWEKAETLTKAKGAFTAEDLTDCMTAEYEVSRDRAFADVQSTLQAWLDAGVIEN